MDSDELMGRVRTLRGQGRSPKEIARALGLPPAEVTPLVRAVAAENEANAPERQAVEYLVSAGWSAGLTVDGHPEGHPDWPGLDAAQSGTSGLVTVLAAREEHRGKVNVCGWLVDTYCLGVKNAVPPSSMSRRRAAAFTEQYFALYDEPPLAAPVELVQHLVLGAVEYARGLGFEPHPDFKATAGQLEPWTGPSAITFGRDGKPYFAQGPNDDAAEVVRKLDRAVGEGNYHFTVSP